MASPRLDAGVRGRHHDKRGHKAKKKDSTKRYNKVAPCQVGNYCLPKITQKRLTNKNAFCFQGALNMSPHSRGRKGPEKKKPKRGSTDFDLHCLLKAAKTKNPTGQPPSASDSSSSVMNSSCTFVESLIENKRQIKPSRSTAHHISNNKNERASKSQISSESNGSSFTDNHMAAGNIPHILKPMDSYHDDFNTKNQESLCKNSSPLKSQQANLQMSTKDSALQPTARTFSLSSYQKFGAKLVEAFVLEKKKQFPSPSQNWLRDSGEDLCNIYYNTHSTQLQHKGLDKAKQSLPINSAADKDESNKKHCIKMGKIDKSKCLGENERKVKFENPTLKDTQEEKVFKEKTVEAWVNAIPGSVPTKYYEKYDKVIHFNRKNPPSHEIADKEFLKNFKENISGLKSSKVHVDNLPFLAGDGMAEYSPFVPQNENFELLRNPRNLTTKEQRSKSQKSWIPLFTGKSANYASEVSPVGPDLFDPPFSLPNETIQLGQDAGKKQSDVWQNKKDNCKLFSWNIFLKSPKHDKTKAGFHMPHSKINQGTEGYKDKASVRFSPRFMF